MPFSFYLSNYYYLHCSDRHRSRRCRCERLFPCYRFIDSFSSLRLSSVSFRVLSCLHLDSTTNLIPKIVGICVGGVLAIATICFLYIVLACIGAREGYFTYTNNDATRSYSGRAYALIPPSHRNAHLYIPHDYSQMTESSYATTVVSPVSTVPVNHSIVPLTHRSAAKPNITIEVPERLLTGRKLSPRSRERSLNKVVKNLGHIVEDAKKHCNGDMPSKVIVKVDDHIDGK